MEMVDLCWLPEVQTGCHQVVKLRSGGGRVLRQVRKKLAQQQEAHRAGKKVQQKLHELERWLSG